MEKVTPSELSSIISALFECPSLPPLLIFGPPGIGKTHIVYQTAEKFGAFVKVVRLSLVGQEEVGSMPIPDLKEHKIRYFPTDLMEIPDEYKDRRNRVVFFFDELGCAKPEVQNAALNLFLEGRLHGVDISGTVRIAATNRAEDRAFVHSITSPLISRSTLIELVNTPVEWEKWAIKNDIHPSVVAYIVRGGGTLCGEPRIDDAYPSPRQWESVSRWCYARDNKQITDEHFQAVTVGCVGAEEAHKYIYYDRYYRDLPNIFDVVKNPSIDMHKIMVPFLEKKVDGARAKLYMFCYILSRAAGTFLGTVHERAYIRRLLECWRELANYDLNSYAVAFAHVVDPNMLLHIAKVVTSKPNWLSKGLVDGSRRVWRVVNEALGRVEQTGV